jgi:hypothetical protein
MNTPQQQRALILHRLAWGVLALGFCAALAVYLTHDPAPTQVVGYEKVNGVWVPVPAEDDRRYQLEVERIGGKMGLAMVEFNDWFAGLWQGRTLAYTLVVITLAFAALLRFVGNELGRDPDPADDTATPGPPPR